MNRHDPWTGFGDETNTSVKFSIVHDGGKVSDWVNTPRLAHFDIPNSASQVVQYLGMNPWEARFRLLLDSVADLDLLDALQGTRHTLRYTAGVTKTVGGYIEVANHGVSYLTLPDTLLVRLQDAQIHYRSGLCSVTAIFQRTASTTAYYGFSTYAEDLP